MMPTQMKNGMKEEEVDLEYAGVMKDRLKSDSPEATNMRIYLESLEDRLGLDLTQKFVQVFAQALDIIEEANEYSAFRYSKFTKPRNNVFFTLVISEDIKDYTTIEPFLAVLMKNKDFNKTEFLWDFEKFKDRVELMLDWYDDINTNGILTHEHYLDPWNDITDEEVPLYLEDEQEELENQKVRLQIYIQQCENKKKIISKQNKQIMKKLEKFGVTKKSDLQFLGESTTMGKKPNNEEQKELYTTLEEHEMEIEPVVKTWFDNELEVIESKSNIKIAKKKIKKLEKGEKVHPNFMSKSTFIIKYNF